MTKWRDDMPRENHPNPLRRVLTRRVVLDWVSRIAGGSAFLVLSGNAARAAKSLVTPAQVAGPYYPAVKPGEADWNLLSVAGGPPPDGVPLDLSGTVSDRAGRPVAGAGVEIWQCDNQGIYDHPRDDNRARFDRRFQGYGATETGADGRFRFLTLMPVPYPDRPPHIHVTIRRPGRDTLTTQLYLRDHPENDRDGLLALMMYPGQDLLMIDPRDADLDGGTRGKAATYDFVVS
jgi:protocatechuate 3,4-dioxygenase, beta subunit